MSIVPQKSAELMQTTSLTGLQVEILEAKKDEKIKDVSDEQILRVLANVVTMVGIKNLPDKVAKMKLLDWLRRRYELFALAEIALAFDLAIAREFECEIRPFGFLSCEYVGGVLAAYKAYKKKSISGSVLSLAHPQPEVLALKQKKDQEQEMRQKLEEMALENAYERFLAGEQDLQMPLTVIYDDSRIKATIGWYNSKSGNYIFPLKWIKRRGLRRFMSAKYEQYEIYMPHWKMDCVSERRSRDINNLRKEDSVLWLFETWKRWGWRTVFGEE